MTISPPFLFFTSLCSAMLKRSLGYAYVSFHQKADAERARVLLHLADGRGDALRGCVCAEERGRRGRRASLAESSCARGASEQCVRCAAGRIVEERGVQGRATVGVRGVGGRLPCLSSRGRCP